MLIVNFILGLLPIIWLVISLCGMKWPGYKASFGALLIAVVEAIAYFNFSVVDTMTSMLEGFAAALWPIVIVIIAAVFTYNLCLSTGSIERIKLLLTSVTNDKRLLVVLIGWCFGGFMEGMAGFGTAVAIPASMLWGLGFDPITACLVCLVANATPTPFGSIGIPTVTLATNLGMQNNLISFATVCILSILIIITPFIMVMIIGKGFKAFKGIVPVLLISGFSFLIPELIVSYFVGAELTVVAGSVCSLFCTVFACMKLVNKDKIPEEYKIAVKKKPEHINLGDTLKALSPFILIFVVLLLTSKICAPINTFLGQFKTTIKISTYESASASSFSWINTPGVLIFICAIIGGFIQNSTIQDMVNVFISTLKQMAFTVLTMLFILGTARVMQYSGMISAVAALFSIFGSFYPFFAPLLGALGTFVTGSGTSSSALFGSVQYSIAETINANPYWLVAANSLGVATGKMMAPQSIAIGLVSVNEAGKDGELLGKVVPYAIVFIVISMLICFFGQGIWSIFGIG
ncbi:MAG: L-lactate permease [Erysipelotrichaceae bacterium]|nr:L-lactate permease [Erysipelotrichaceae bacterium]